MADIFGTTQLPPYMQTGTGVDIVNRGQQAYQQSLRNFSDLAVQQQEVQQKKALLPLLLQQQQNQISNQALDIQQRQFQTQNMLDAKEGIVALAGVGADITDWADPSTPAKWAQVVKQYPAVALTPDGQKYLNQFEQMHQVAVGADTRLQQSQMTSAARLESMRMRTEELATAAENANKTRLQIEQENNQTKSELAKEKYANQLQNSNGFDALGRAHQKLFSAELDKLKSDPTIQPAQFNQQAERLLGNWVQKYGVNPKIPVGTNPTPAQPAGVAAPQAAAPSFNSPDEVRAAVKAGKLTREQAVGVLQQKFGFQP